MFYFVLAVVVEAVMAHISSCFWISPFPQIQCLLLRHSASALQSRSPEWFLYEVFKSNSQIKNLGPGDGGGWRVKKVLFLAGGGAEVTGKQPVSVCCLWHQRICQKSKVPHWWPLWAPCLSSKVPDNSVVFFPFAFKHSGNLSNLRLSGESVFVEFSKSLPVEIA